MMRAVLMAAAVLGVADTHAGGKNATDEVVRTEMKVIRDLTLDVHTLVTHRRLPPADAHVPCPDQGFGRAAAQHNDAGWRRAG